MSCPNPGNCPIQRFFRRFSPLRREPRPPEPKEAPPEPAPQRVTPRPPGLRLPRPAGGEHTGET